MPTDRDDIERLRDRAPGEAMEDVYRDVDVSSLPDWWRTAIEEHRESGLRPYQPPRFADDELKHEVVEDLEAEYGVDVEFVCLDAAGDGDWSMLVDGETAATVGHRRSVSGYSVFEIESDAARELVRESVEGSGDSSEESEGNGAP